MQVLLRLEAPVLGQHQGIRPAQLQVLSEWFFKAHICVHAQVLLNLEAVSWVSPCQRTSPGALMASVTPPGLTLPSAAQMYGTGWVRLQRSHML